MERGDLGRENYIGKKGVLKNRFNPLTLESE
jgi:hypothetical protein